jgi:hypothetical protein
MRFSQQHKYSKHTHYRRHQAAKQSYGGLLRGAPTREKPGSADLVPFRFHKKKGGGVTEVFLCVLTWLRTRSRSTCTQVHISTEEDPSKLRTPVLFSACYGESG